MAQKAYDVAVTHVRAAKLSVSTRTPLHPFEKQMFANTVDQYWDIALRSESELIGQGVLPKAIPKGGYSRIFQNYILDYNPQDNSTLPGFKEGAISFLSLFEKKLLKAETEQKKELMQTI